MEKNWWKEAVVYQIYPRSFKDSNSDGIGDLKGIIQKLGYIKELGADVIWLCPVYKSPNDDNGYDISDYQDIMTEFGTMADFDELLRAAHAFGIKVIMDLVVNHTSDEHPWFTQSRESKDNPYRDYYFWREGKDGNPPNNWESSFGGSAWQWDEKTGMYYLHLFSPKQADLNWENPSVRRSVYEMMTWWLAKGVDGFRMDVISFISKTAGLPDAALKDGLFGDFGPSVINGPRVHEYLQEMNREVLSKFDVVTVGETPGVTVEDAKKYAGSDDTELNMVFQFEQMDFDIGENGKWNNNAFKLADFKRIMSKWQVGLNGCAWNSLFLNNHDQPRAVSHFGNDSTPLFWEKSAKMLATCLHMMQGTPYIYQGEELGMTNVAFDKLEDYRDIETLNAYDELVNKKGVSPQTMMTYIHRIGRDNARTPMQWDTSPNAGFSCANPWIQVNPNYVRINAQNEFGDPQSIFNYYKKLIQLRKQYEIIAYGKFELLYGDDAQIFAYTRTLKDQTLLVITNFSETPAEFVFPQELWTKDRELLIANYQIDSTRSAFSLKPYEARVYLLTR